MTDRARAVVTGASNGIGLVIATGLARDGYEVVLVGRDPERVARAEQHLHELVPDSDVVPEVVDLGLVREVRALADRLVAGPPPAVVVSNAATVVPLESTTSEGLPTMLATNHLAPFVLLPMLADAVGQRPARFVVVAADPAALGQRPVDLDDLCLTDREALGENEDIRPFRAYGRTKAMNIMFATTLARRLSDASIAVNAAHPGIIAGTGLARMAPGVETAVAKAYDLDRSTLPDVEVGADTPLWLATSAEADGVSGRTFVDRKPVELAEHLTDPERGDLLWERSAALVAPLV